MGRSCNALEKINLFLKESYYSHFQYLLLFAKDRENFKWDPMRLLVLTPLKTHVELSGNLVENIPDGLFNRHFGLEA